MLGEGIGVRGGGLKECISGENVGLNKGWGGVNRRVKMGLGWEMDERVWVMVSE